MSLIKIENLSFSYYGYSGDVFNNVSLSFDTNWRLGLIGRNGIGKTTLFKLLLGEEKYQGKISKSVDLIKFPPTINDENLSCIDLFSIHGGDEEWKFLKELSLLNIDDSFLYRSFSSLSKGEQTKVLLAILFTKDDGYLLIDEPTNHLDIDGREVVSNYLRSKKGFLLISHDRNFLDSCIDHVISINNNSIDVQTGNFSSWYENKEKKDKFELDENEKLKKDIKRLKKAAKQTKEWSDKVEETKNGVKVSGVKPDKGRIGKLAAKMMKKSKNLEHRQNKAIQEKEKLLKDIDVKEELKLNALSSRKETLIKIENLNAFYNDNQILKDINFNIKVGDRIAVYGGNGSGKSTLLKIILGENINYNGIVRCTSDLKISYISQDASNLSGNLRDYIKNEGVDEAICKSLLRKLGFSRQLFDSNMENYSDGQKKKVLIAISLSKPAHLFIWDEPLNYIDVISRIQLEEIILKSNLTLLFVEHDKNFVDKVATKVIML